MNPPEVTAQTKIGTLRMTFSNPGQAYCEVVDPVINRVQYGTCIARLERSPNGVWDISRTTAGLGIYGMRKDWSDRSYNAAQLHGPARIQFRNLCLDEAERAYTPAIDRAAWYYQKYCTTTRLSAKVDELQAKLDEVTAMLKQEQDREYPTPQPEIKL